MTAKRDAIPETPIALDGESLTIDRIAAIGEGRAKVEITGDAFRRSAASRAFLETALRNGQTLYGVNTSFGPMCGKILSGAALETAQTNLVRSHAAGMGEPLAPSLAAATLAVRLNALAKGYSGVRAATLERLRDMINGGIAPYIPERGSVGASGDLTHLAHAALAVIGEGQVFFRGRLTTATEADKAIGSRPIALSYKEGLALINGTSAMTAIAAFAVRNARRLLRASLASAAFGAEIFNAIGDAFDADLHRLKPHPGQRAAAAASRAFLEGSRNIRDRQEIHEAAQDHHRRPDAPSVIDTAIAVQDVYSVRCAPQVLAPVFDAVDYAARIIETEANSATDNPLICPDTGKIFHGGHFHGQSVSFAMDILRIAIATLCNLSERRLNKLLDHKLNGGLPEHLARQNPGLELGFMGAQYLATSTTAENRHLAAPMSVQNISCNAANQDVVSMGTVSARKTLEQSENAADVLAVEMLADLQALSFRGAEGLGQGSRRLYDRLRQDFAPYDNRAPFHEVLKAFRDRVFQSDFFDRDIVE